VTLPDRPHGPSDKSRTVALALALLLGVLGAHRFYGGRTASAILMLVTLGGLGIWWMFDVIVVAAGGFHDGLGRLVSDWDPSSADLGGRRDLDAVLDELDALRLEVTDLAERLDFAERLLAKPAEERQR
jgi:TM2 domain-containing membrane protein YozV